MTSRTDSASTAQPGLFGTGPQVLADDERGRIVYTPEFLSAALAQQSFVRLLADVPWQAERRRMYERDVAVPRLLASYALDGELPAPLPQLAQQVRDHVGAPFTHVGLNLYRDGRDSVAPHNDHLYELRPGQPVALLSLGATRDMVISTKLQPRRSLRLPLQAGSLLLMSHATQLHYDHGIPKVRDAVGPRISLAFRVRAAGARQARY
ncbi:alpha-ketoglutarate-dependent dioxygenase AlkB [Tahibacter harae]|uniref:Alpha-ketoglutarate-dependent dioxygenase AlkB n=1 Tax=Tahibacter harae TaxID=2963937 RepID=A0ABT1QN98_9GAMM|nr:alpha-ketoglutarate-dependent dioxygenase AlkB [Tahibacter harae]MCQ4163897.1 alpha-ketoglutarate-dependent dioxygenase AlkB [Tahibacter harae]